MQEKLEFDFDIDTKIPHCIIGDNESGKTTILKGIELIGKLCEGEIIDNTAIKSIRPKGSYFSGTLKLGAVLTCEKNIIDENGPSIKKDILSKTKDNIIDISLEFEYTFENSNFMENSNKTIINFNNSFLTNKDDKDKIFNIIKKHAPDIIYYDDFKFVVPKAIRFLESNKTSNDNTLSGTQNKHWQGIFDDILKGHNPKAKSF